MKKRWIVPIVLGVGLIALGTNKQGDAQTVRVSTQILQTQTVEQTVSCNGVVEVGECAYVSADMACVLQEVLVEVGQQVKIGDPLLTIDKQATQQMYRSADRVGNALQLATMSDTISSPTDGIVLSVDVADDGLLAVGVPCVTIAPRDALQVRVMIREKLLPSLEVGQTVRVSGAGFDKEVYDGRLTEISSAASANSIGGESVVEGVVTFAKGETDASMRLGLTAKAKVVVSRVEEGLLLPYEAVCEDADGVSYVYLAQDDCAVYTAITPLEQLSGGVLVAEQTLDGSTVILEPELVTQNGMPIQPAEQEVDG